MSEDLGQHAADSNREHLIPGRGNGGRGIFVVSDTCGVCGIKLGEDRWCGVCAALEAEYEAKRMHKLFELQPRVRVGNVTRLPTPLMFRIQDFVVALAARYPRLTALALALGICAVIRLI